jgi:hypothetical protein
MCNNLKLPVVGMPIVAVILFMIMAIPMTAQSQSDEIIPYVFEIGQIETVLSGENISIPVIKSAGSQPLLGFDFLIGYDNVALAFAGVDPGELFDDPGNYEWEYFNYGYNNNSGCGNDCPTGLIHVIGLADQNDGDNHPLETFIPDGMVLFNLGFQATNDFTYIGLFIPIRFYWLDCADNAVSYEDSSYIPLALAQNIYDYNGADIADTSAGFPSYYGPMPICFVGSNPPEPFIDLSNGGVRIMGSGFMYVHWGDTAEFDVPAVDPDPDNACDDLTFTMLEGPSAAEFDSLTGHFFWPTTADDICYTTVAVEIADGCGATSEYAMNICVRNDPPQTTVNPDDTIYVGWDHILSGQVEATDPDNGPNALVYRIASFNGPTWFADGMQIDSVSGVWTWGIAEDHEYLGDFELTVEISDGAPICEGCNNGNAAYAHYNIHVIGQAITIEKVHEQNLGAIARVSILLDSTYMGRILTFDLIGGFDFLVAFDASILTPLGAYPGTLIDEGKFEYFTYRIGPVGNCPDGCPSGMFRIVGIRESNDGVVNDYHLTSPGQLVKMQFLVTDDMAFEGQFVPIRFYWTDCGDNTLSDESGDWLFAASSILGYEGYDVSDTAEIFGYSGPEDSCLDTVYYAGGTFNNAPIGSIVFKNGGVDISPDYFLDDRGDVNLNGIPNEIADFVVFQNYFLYGPSAFTINFEQQKAATDVNDDGITLTIQDLTYLLRIIDGDLLPVSSSNKGPWNNFDGAIYITETDSSIIISSDFADSVGILYMTFSAAGVQSDSDYVINVDPGIAYMNVGNHGYPGHMRILIWQFASGPPENDSASIKPGFRKLLEIYSPGGIPELDAAAAAGFLAEYVNISVYDLPSNKPILEPYPSAMTNDFYGGFEYQFSAIYPDKFDSPLRYNIISGPGDIDPVTGLWKFAPLCVDNGTTYTLEVCASDPIHPCESGDSTQIATVELSIVNDIPAVGDADGDGEVAFQDIIRVISYKYLNGDEPVPSYRVADVNADGVVNILDIVYLIMYLYLDGPPPQCP